MKLALTAYAQGLFPMDDPDAQDAPLPFYRADPRAIFDLDDLDRTRRAAKRSLAKDPGWRPATDEAFEEVLAGCAQARGEGGVWLTPRLAGLYRELHIAGAAHSFELWDGETLAAGILGVVIGPPARPDPAGAGGGVAMLESMFHTVSHAGNVNLVRTLESLRRNGIRLCDIQLISEHTRRLGAFHVSAEEFERRLAAALGP